MRTPYTCTCGTVRLSYTAALRPLTPQKNVLVPRGSLISRLAVMSRPEGFDYVERAGELIITHRGKQATVLRGVRAASFLEDVEAGDPQELMARLTGNYRRGNERQARQHPRNRSR